jgi:LysM repeat protein
MKLRRAHPLYFALLLVSTGLFSGCSTPTVITLPSPTTQVRVTPQPSATPVTKTSTPSPVAVTRMTSTLLPTATPFTYSVVEGDTLLGIAYRYGITLDDLMAANPGVEPRLLSVGTVLIIPITGEIHTSPLTDTPFPLSAEAPVCYPSMDGGAWCVLQITNEQPGGLENISGWIELFGADGHILTGKMVYAPLNILPADKTLSLQAYFPAPLPENYTAQGSILSALPVPEVDSRYLLATTDIQVLEIAISRKEALISGWVSLPLDQPPPGVVWVVALAYSESDRVVGMRKWEQVQPCPSTSEQGATCGPLPYKMTVYSLGPDIQRVEVLVEARRGN